MADHGVDGEQGGARVVSLAEAAKDVRFPVVNELETYWHALRGDRAVPARSEVDPRRIENALEYAFVLERIAPGMARFRLAGMHLNDIMGMEVRGMPLTAFFTPEARRRVGATLERVFEAPARAQLALAGEQGMGRPPLEGRLLLLPLKSDFGDVTRALGCFCTLGPVGRTPRRFDVTAEDIVPVRAPTRASGDRPSSAPPPANRGAKADTAPRGLAEPGAPFARSGAEEGSSHPGRRKAGGRPRLYLVRSDDEANDGPDDRTGGA